jgi:peptidoglycan/LPS O-acetylase OafA/YrhL
MVSIFFLLSGYVCGIKPIRLSAEGKADEARKVIGSSAFRRIFRIGIPASFGTLLAWTLAQIGAFRIVPEVEIEGMWLERTTPKRIPGIIAPIRELIKQCVLSSITLLI